MSGTTPVAQYGTTDFTSQTATAYKTQIDANSVVAQRIVGRFAPHAQASPNMTVRLDAGSIFDGVTLTEVAAQSTSTITAPTSHPRIDRLVIDNTTGAVSVVTGTQATSPVAPAIPNGKSPVAQVLIQTTSTSITNTMITDERNFGGMAVGGFGAQATIGSASTCDLGTVLSRNASITGTTSITSFGSSANTQNPIYLIEFAAALTLTNGASLVLPSGANITTAAGDTAVAEYLGSGNWRVRSYTKVSGKALTSSAMTYTALDPASTTYTTPTGCTGLIVAMMADGGGGGARNTHAGSSGSGSTFSDWTCNGGQGGNPATSSNVENGGAGGTGGTNGTGTLIRRISGQKGNMALDNGGAGASGPWGGAGGATSIAGVNAAPGSGSGGSGAGAQSGASFYGAGGGGAGEYVEFYIPSPSSSYAYSIGPGGAGGTAGASAGGAGASGCITVQALFS